MVELLSRPRVFVAALWLTGMLISGVLGGILMDFDLGTLAVWLVLTLLGPALVGCMVLVQAPGTPRRD